MLDMSDILAAKKKAVINQEKNIQNYENEFNEGLKLFTKFQKDLDEKTIKSASEKFFSALRFKRTQMAPYLYLSMIFLIFNERETALEYFETAEILKSSNPEYLDLLNKIKSII